MTSKTDFSGQHFLPIGSCIAEFEIKGLIGEGGFGTVYLAFDHSLLRTVALKEFLPTALAQRGDALRVVIRSERNRETFEAGMKSFINEARLLAQFDHPALVKVYRFWEANNTAYMVMPFYEGISLKQLVFDHPEKIDEPYLIGILAPLLDALEHLHQLQIYHRDIAPDNIMILDTGMPVLLDFGAARRVITDMAQALTVILKPGFAPIEQYADDASLKQGSWTDIYALSAVLYYAILRKAPPAAVSRMVKDNMQPLVRNPTLTNFSSTFLDAIDAGLAIAPENRIQTIEQFRHRLGLRTYILPSASVQPAPVHSGTVLTTLPTQAGVAAEALGALATSIPRTQPQIGAKPLSKAEPALPSLSANSEFERATKISEDQDEKLSGTYDPNKTNVIFNPSTVSLLAEDFDADPPALAAQEEIVEVPSSVQNLTQSSTVPTDSTLADPLPRPEDLMATRILNPAALRKVMAAERTDAGKQGFVSNNPSVVSGVISPAPVSVTGSADLATRILPIPQTTSEFAPPLNKPAASKSPKPKSVNPSSSEAKSGAAKPKPPGVLVKPAGKKTGKGKPPVLAITLGLAGLISLAGMIWVVTVQMRGKTNTPVSTPAIATAPRPEFPPPAAPAPIASPVIADALPSVSTSPVPEGSVSNNVASVTEPSPSLQQVIDQAAVNSPVKETSALDEVKPSSPEKLAEPTKPLSEEANKPLPGKVLLTVKPWGTVTIGGISRGVSPPLKTVSLAEGRYTVKIENPGFTPFVTTIEVKKGKTFPLSYTFSNSRTTP